MLATSSMKRILFSGILILAVVAVIELLSMVAYRYFAPPAGKQVVEYLLADGKSSTPMRLLSHPYMLYVNNPEFPQHNTLGFRGREVSPEKKSGVIRIIAMGGSTTYGQGVKAVEDTWVGRLESILNEALEGCTVEVINSGIVYGSSPELLSHYIYRNRYLDPDLVILHTGGNDSGPLMMNKYNPEYTEWRGWKATTSFELRRFERQLLRSRFFKVLYSFWMHQGASMDSFVQTKSPFSDGISPAKALENVAEHEPIGFARNIDLLVRNMLQDGVVPVVFPYLEVPEAGWAKTSWAEYREAGALALTKNTKVLHEIAEKYGVPVVDIPPESIPDHDFVDQSHVNEHGHELKARAVAEVILPLVVEISNKRCGSN